MPAALMKTKAIRPEDLKRDKTLFGDRLSGKSDSHRLYACTLNVSISLLEPKY